MGALRRSSGSGSAAVQVWFVNVDFHDAVGARVVNEFLYARACLSYDTVPVMTGPGNQPSWLLVVVGAGRGRTTTSRRARPWARATVGQRAGDGWAHARAILH
jgi:hypothetical protein